MTIKMFFVKLLRIPFRLRSIFYVKWNRINFWLNDVSFGKRMLINNSFYLQKHPKASLSIGDDFVIFSGDSLNPLCRNIQGCIYLPFSSSRIEIGNDTGLSSPCLWAKDRITIGNRVKIGGDCILMDTDAHNLDFRVRCSKEIVDGYIKDSVTASSAPIVIEDDVLVGTRCIILKGVTIGARSIIGSGSVVTKSIPADSVAAGNPCKVIRKINM
jgi:acetyltransferase-like isoleucine patch superfamily enzyme